MHGSQARAGAALVDRKTLEEQLLLLLLRLPGKEIEAHSELLEEDCSEIGSFVGIRTLSCPIQKVKKLSKSSSFCATVEKLPSLPHCCMLRLCGADDSFSLHFYTTVLPFRAMAGSCKKHCRWTLFDEGLLVYPIPCLRVMVRNALLKSNVVLHVFFYYYCRKLFRADLHGGAGFVICYFQAEGSDRLFGAARDWVCLLRVIGVQEYEWRGCLCRVLMRW